MELSIAFLFLGSIGVYYLIKYRKELEKTRLSVAEFDSINREMQGTMAIGLYHRFKREEGKEENPFEFEHFVAKVVRDYYGGKTYVTPPSHDFGIDIEHYREDGYYLGQVKCYAGPLGYEPIAIVHSQMVKQNAKGGFVVTTGSYTDSARFYAQDHNIQLIDGLQLVQMWTKGVNRKIDFFNTVDKNSELTV